MARRIHIERLVGVVIEAMQTIALPCTPGQAYDAATLLLESRPDLADLRIDYAQVCRFLSQFPEFTKVAPASYSLASLASHGDRFLVRVDRVVHQHVVLSVSAATEEDAVNRAGELAQSPSSLAWREDKAQIERVTIQEPREDRGRCPNCGLASRSGNHSCIDTASP